MSEKNDFLRGFPQISTLCNDESLRDFEPYLRNFFAKIVVAEFKTFLLKKSENSVNLNEKFTENSQNFTPKNAELFSEKNAKKFTPLEKKFTPQVLKTAILKEIYEKITEFKSKDYKSLINATGVVLHTNLGRSVINESIFESCKSLVCGHFNLEFDLKSGKRGDRYGVLLEKFNILFNADDALIVNNNAAAVFLVLNTLAKDREVITSRGELVEIGGSFRVPETMKLAGAKLVEIGTTNKTNLLDYENAISCDTALLLKTHKSNFSFTGFYDEVPLNELFTLSKRAKVPLYYDLGSGWCGKMPAKLVKNEPSIKELLAKCDILSFSADKLFGSVQAGVILGKKELIKRLKINQILRMLRVDKFTLCLLNESVKAYLNEEYNKISTLKLLNDSLSNIKEKALKVQKGIKLKCELKESKSLVGGGSMPDKALPSFVLAFFGEPLSLQGAFRELSIIGRIENERFVLDFRSVLEKDLGKICTLINENFK